MVVAEHDASWRVERVQHENVTASNRGFSARSLHSTLPACCGLWGNGTHSSDGRKLSPPVFGDVSAARTMAQKWFDNIGDSYSIRAQQQESGSEWELMYR